jgi:cobalt-zinc-cadmium efflux system membrane fusion protein
MLATMTIYGKTEKHPCVPLTAIVRENEQDHVFVASAPKTFTLQPIQLGTEFKSCRPLTGETILDRPIVLDGAFHLNNERRRRAQRSGAGE